VLCGPQRIRWSLPNWCGLQRIRGSLLKSCCSQQIRGSLSNYVVRSESGVCCRIVLSATNQVFAAELCCPRRIRCSLPNYVVRSELAFAAESVRPAANQFSLPKCATCTESVSLPIFYNSSPSRNDLNACNNFIV
jgi:hypothetical protein